MVFLVKVYFAISVCSPICPAKMDWSVLYPKFYEQSAESLSTAFTEVQFADIGCGYGGLLGNCSLLTCNSVNFAKSTAKKDCKAFVITNALQSFFAVLLAK